MYDSAHVDPTYNVQCVPHVDLNYVDLRQAIREFRRCLEQYGHASFTFNEDGAHWDVVATRCK